MLFTLLLKFAFICNSLSITSFVQSFYVCTGLKRYVHVDKVSDKPVHFYSSTETQSELSQSKHTTDCLLNHEFSLFRLLSCR